jgi:Kef-type K+ transport system membrane component KefB/nucleotide-binding universal stress UspA family protein
VHILSNPLTIFIAQAILVVTASRAVAMLTRKLRQPMVIAEIVAGIMLGPSVLGLLLPSVEASVFPKTSMPALGLVSQVGLILFMFIIGLELHPKLLKGRARQAVAISHASIVLPFALGGLSAFYLYGVLAAPGVSFTSFLLFMGASMSVTAFPVLARILVERRLLRTRIGATAISCAAVDDVTAWCILAFVVSIVRSSSLMDAVRTVVLATGYILVMLLVVRPFLERLAGRGRVKLSQGVVAMTLVAVMISSWVTELIGIHALFGAFVFGAIIPKQGSTAAALAEKVEDVVVALLLPLFFAYSGLRTQIGLLDTPSAWITCAGITLIACVGKFGGSAIAARVTGFSWREASAIGILMNTRGLVELIVLNIGLDLGVISPRLFTMLVIMALVTTFMTTPLLERVYPMERFARELDEQAGPVSSAIGRFTVLTCVADETTAPGLVTLGASLAGRSAPDARLYALRLVPPDERTSTLLASSNDEDATNDSPADPVLETAITRGRALNARVGPLSFISATRARDICDVADVKRASVLVLGWREGRRRASEGVIEHVLRETSRDAAILVDRGLVTIHKLLVAFGGSEQETLALRFAVRIATNTGAQLTVLAVSPMEDALVLQRIEAAAREELVALSEDKFKIIGLVDEQPARAVATESAKGYDVVLLTAGAQWGVSDHSFALDPERVVDGFKSSVVVVRRGRLDAVATITVDAGVARHIDETAARYSTLRPPGAA